MKQLQPTHIDHTLLYVRDVEETKIYLESLFDFSFFPHPNDRNVVAVESEHVHFFLKKNDSSGSALMEQHLSFGTQNIEEVITKLDSLDISYDRGTFTSFTHQNYHWVEWRGPDGIRWECEEKIVSKKTHWHSG